METFNSYLLEAVDQIHKNWAKKGYAPAAYTHNFKLGHIEFNASNPPYTMCVAAQMEIIVAALNIYEDKTGDSSFLNYLPDKQWTRQSPGTFKNLVWVNSGSLGTAFALERFGMGHQCPFDALEPGCFVNLNRSNKTGHAVLFLGYLDEKGNALEKFGPKVAGFKYYSSQGNESDGGFDYRYAFFGSVKPILDGGRKRDIGLIRSDKQKYLNCGYMRHPNSWVTPLGISDVDLDRPEENLNPAYLNQTTVDDQPGQAFATVATRPRAGPAKLSVDGAMIIAICAEVAGDDSIGDASVWAIVELAGDPWRDHKIKVGKGQDVTYDVISGSAKSEATRSIDEVQQYGSLLFLKSLTR